MTAIFYFLLFGLSIALELKQVMILSRHNLRTPLTEHLSNLSPRVWPKWDEKVGYLTKKGALLEGFLGDYFGKWLKHHKLIDDCPINPFIYANTRQRTKATAKAFVDAAFRNCNIPVFSKNMTAMDPVFNPVPRNTTEAFREQAVSEMKRWLNETYLKDVYLELNRITDIKESHICKEHSLCDLATAPDEIVFTVGSEPNVTQRMFIGVSMVDSFLMSYYEGFPLEDVAWGEIRSEEEWELLMRITKASLHVKFDLPKSAKDLVKPLLQCMKEIIGSNKTFSLLVGHDSNLTPVMAALRFRKYTTPDQLELVPIGAKLVFQRWTNGTEDFLKVEYVYGSWSQIRNAEKLSLENPPKNVTMFLNDYADDNGFYAWSDFEKIMSDVTE